MKSGVGSRWKLVPVLEEENDMFVVLASDPLAPWGQAAAILIGLYLFIVVLIGLVLALVLMLGLGWVQQKSQLIKRLRPTVESVNTTSEAALAGKLPPPGDSDNKLVRTVAEVPEYAHIAEQKVEMVSDRVAHGVIEYRARTQMVKGMAKAFFLPGLMHRPQAQTALEEEGVGFRSPGYRILVEEKTGEDVPTGVGDGYRGAITASQLKDAPVDVSAFAPEESRQAASSSSQNYNVRNP